MSDEKDKAGAWVDTDDTEIEVEAGLPEPGTGDETDALLEGVGEAEVYSGIPTDEDIGASTDDEEVVIESGGEEIEVEAGGEIGEGSQRRSLEEWRSIAAGMEAEARAQADVALAARLMAEAGRILEMRVGDRSRALVLYLAARQMSAATLPALEGARRVLLLEGRIDDALECLGEELALAIDPPVKARLESLRMEVTGFRLLGQPEAGPGPSGPAPGSGEDAYPVLLDALRGLATGDAALASAAMLDLAGRAEDPLFVSQLSSSAGLLAEVAGDASRAGAAYAAAIAVRPSDELARAAGWRDKVSKCSWADAVEISQAPGLDPGTPISIGHSFLRAALHLFSLGRVEETVGLLALVPPGAPEKVLRFLAAPGGDASGSGASEAVEEMLPPSALRAALAWDRTSALAGDDRLRALHEILDQSPGLDAVRVDLVETLADPAHAEHAPYLHALVEEAAGRVGGSWLVEEAALALLETGRAEEGTTVAARALSLGSPESFLWGAILRLIGRGETGRAVSLAAGGATGISDAGLAAAFGYMGAVLAEFDPASAPAAPAPAAPTGSLGAHLLLESAIRACTGGSPVGTSDIEAALGSGSAVAAVPAAIAALASGGGGSGAAPARVALWRRILDLSPGHIPAFIALRRELLSSGKVGEYGGDLDSWISRAGDAAAHLEGERIALVTLGAGSSLGEEDLSRLLGGSGDDPFVPIFLAGLDRFPALAAASTERLASGLGAEAADPWWYEAARRWMLVDPQRGAAALAHVSGKEWKRAAEGLMEAAAWTTGRWDDAAGRLLESMRAIPEGESQERILARMVYVDGFLKGEHSMALAEAESLLQTPGGPTNVFCLRFLYRELLREGRVEESAGPLIALARLLQGSDESSAFAWLSLRATRGAAHRAKEMADLVKDLLKSRAGDLPMLLVADSIARRDGDMDLLASVLAEMAGTVEGTREQGALEWVLALVMAAKDLERAASAAREAVERLPGNPVAALTVEKIAALREDWATAAMFAKQAGSLTRVSSFAVEDLLRAGSIYREKLHEDGWAVQCLEQAMNLDPSDSRPFEALRDHFTAIGDWDHVATLLEERALHLEDAGARFELLRNLAQVYERANRQPEAIAALRRILSEVPEDPESLENLAALSIKGALWDDAVHALQERATLGMTPEEKARIFRTLGDLYVNHVPNDQRAIVCYEKVMETGDRDVDMVKELVRLYEKTGAWEKGLKAAEFLFVNSEDDEDKAGWLVTGGRFWQVGPKDLRKAEQSFEMARKLVPGMAEPVVALIDLYKSQGDQRALSFHVERSLGDLQHFLRSDPGNLDLYHTLYDMALATKEPLSMRVLGTLLECIFDLKPAETVPFSDAGGHFTWTQGPWVASPECDALLAPDSFTPSFKLLAEKLSDAILKSVSFDPARFGISKGTRLSKRQPADEHILEEVARVYGVKPPQVHLVDLIPNVLTVLPDTPPVLVIGDPVYRSMTPEQKRFAFAWGCKLSAAGLVPLVGVGEKGLPALWTAVIQQFEPSFLAVGANADEVFAHVTNLRKNFPRKAREELFGAAIECAGDKRIDVGHLYSDVCGYADRAALLSCGDMGGALQFVWHVATMQEPFRNDYAACTALRECATLARLVEFIAFGKFVRCLPPA